MRYRPFLMVLAALPAAAQSEFPHHNLTLQVGAANPRGEISSFMKSAPQIGFWYGYRFLKYFQADTGLNLFFGAANVRQFVSTDLGNLQVGDREYMLPLGGRVILPLAAGRVLLAAGGGAAWLHYGEHLSNPYSYYGYSVNCDLCTARSGWGSYGLANASYFLDRDQHFRVGVSTQIIRAHTNGDAVGGIPGTRTSDHWINVAGELGFSF